MEHGKDVGFGNNTVTVIAGLSNTYADYVATFAEYQVRKYIVAIDTHTYYVHLRYD